MNFISTWQSLPTKVVGQSGYFSSHPMLFVDIKINQSINQSINGEGIFYCRNLNVDTLHTFIGGFCRTDGAALHVLFGGYGNISFIYSFPL